MRLVVLGGGESGVGTAILGKQKGYDVFVSDYGKIKDTYKEVLTRNEIVWEEEQHTEALILNANVVMKSPGIPDNVSHSETRRIKCGTCRKYWKKFCLASSRKQTRCLCIRIEQFSIGRHHKL